MKHIVQFSLNNSRLTILLLLAIFVGGVVTFLTMPSREDPKITIRSAQVRAYFPGMSTTQLENLIAKPLEKKIRELVEVKQVNTTISSGRVLIGVDLHDRYFDLTSIWQNLRNKMTDVKNELPKGTIGPIVNDDFGDVVAATVALYGRGYTVTELGDAARHMQDQLSTLKSVSKINLYGQQAERIYLDFNISRLAFYGINPSTIISSLTQQNILLPGGSIVANKQRITLIPSGNFESVEEINNLQISAPNTGGVVYLRDIVTLRRALVEPPQTPAFFNAHPAIMLGISMVAQYNINDFGQELSTQIDRLQQQLPAGMQMDYATYQPTLVKQSVDSAVENLYQTIAVVLAIVMVFLGMRTGLIVGSIVPLTILMTLIIMNFFELDLQRMSIAAIIIALGLLVDNGIVIAEDIQSRINKGSLKKDAAIQSVHALGMPLLTSSLTTILAFIPLILSESVTSEYLGTLSKVILIALLSSWFLAIYATPALSCWFLKDINKNKPNNYQGKLYQYYRIFLTLTLNNKIIFTLIMLGLFVASVQGLNGITKQMMPYSDRSQVLIYIDLPAGSDISHTINATEKLRAWLADKTLNPEIKSHISYIGAGGPRFFLALSPINAGSNVAFFIVNTETTADVISVQARTNQFMLNEMPEVNGRVKRMFLGASEIGLVEYRIIGSDAGQLYKIAYDFEKLLRDIPGTVGIYNSWQNPVARIHIDIDQRRARLAGVSSESIAQTLSTYYDGYDIADYRDGDKVIPITLRGDEIRNNLNRLLTLPVPSTDNIPVALVQVANFSRVVESNNLLRVDQERTLTLSAKHTSLQATDLHNRVLEKIQNLTVPVGYRIEFGGEVEASQDSNNALFSKMPIALIGIILLLVWQFNSIRRPAIILLTIPLVLIGAVVGLLITGAFFSFTAILGLFALAGIIVNNGIVLIDRIDSERTYGLSLYEAIIAACMARARPILMTTITTVLGLIPMMLYGGALWYPMAVVIIFGLTVATLLTLGFVPMLYMIFFSFNVKARSKS